MFADGALLVGHNVGFDMRMLRANRTRLALPGGQREYADTLDIARRFLDVDDYSLESLVQHFGIDDVPTHRAMDDVRATTKLLYNLSPYISAHAADRMRAVRDTVEHFVPLAQEIDGLRALAESSRPADLLRSVLQGSGLHDFYAKETRRVANLDELVRVFQARDNTTMDPLSSLESVLDFVTLARNVDRIDPDDRRVRILTVHQSKGLEFDVVFVSGLSQHEFPGYPAVSSGREEEERRVFYVAVTRARRQLILTGHAMHNGKVRDVSPYFGLIGDRWMEEGSTMVSARFRRHSSRGL